MEIQRSGDSCNERLVEAGHKCRDSERCLIIQQSVCEFHQGSERRQAKTERTRIN